MKQSSTSMITKSQPRLDPPKPRFAGPDYGLAKLENEETNLDAQMPPVIPPIEPGEQLEDVAKRAGGAAGSIPLLGVFPPPLVHPKSIAENHEPPLPISSERTAVHDLAVAYRECPSDGLEAESFIEFDLHDFVVYLPKSDAHHALQLRSLQLLATRGHGQFCFDGILSCGHVRRYVQGVTFDLCSVGNYGVDDLDSCEDEVWIQSDHNRKHSIYYRLRKPAAEYARYYTAFQWVTRLSNLFVAYAQQRDKLSVHDFRSDFYQWASSTHGKSKTFQDWYSRFGNEDFRGHVIANIDFLHKEALGLDWSLSKRRIWAELKDMTAIPRHKIVNKKTIVTPYVYHLWSHMPFGHHLQATDPISRRMLTPNDLIASPLKSHRLSSGRYIEAVRPDAINIGDVLAVTKDHDSVWQDETYEPYWYICVTKITRSSKDVSSYHGNWMYLPSDTSCALMKYPYEHELFISDNCTCLSSGIVYNEVRGRLIVAWHGDPAMSMPFCRQAFIGNERFVTLHDKHKLCQHTKQAAPVERFRQGQTVLARPAACQDMQALEPYEVDHYYMQDGKQMVRLRNLYRRSFLPHQGCRPNELVYTDDFESLPADEVQRTCLIRLYEEADVHAKRVPAPYNCDGAANAFYITMRALIDEDENVELLSIHKKPPERMLQGYDPLADLAKPPLQGLDLFSGWGSLARGLEEGGALHNKWVVDLFDAAIHSHWANASKPEDTKMFFGSVDDLLCQALLGNPHHSSLVPAKGEVSFISAGSPCQGFSLLNDRRSNEQGLKNQSLITSIAAYVDFYRPKYGILENVLSISNGKRDEDVLCQLISTLVGMGYQVQQPFLLDAWNYGSPQSRSRLFISFAAPGLEPMIQPPQSHGNPLRSGHRTRNIGKLANGMSFGERIQGPTAFEASNAGKACRDLPMTDGACMMIKHPDHIPSRVLTQRHRLQFSFIPKYPRGMTYVKAWNEGRGVMTPAERELFPMAGGKAMSCAAKGSRAWGRIDPSHLFRTIIVRSACEDARMGVVLHWQQDREMTILEARRAQSAPDHEVLVGSLSSKWKLVGNGVDRKVSMALGIELRKAWLASSDPGDRDVVEPWPVTFKTVVKKPSISYLDSDATSSEEDLGIADLFEGIHTRNYTDTPLSSVDDSGAEESHSKHAALFATNLQRLAAGMKTTMRITKRRDRHGEDTKTIISVKRQRVQVILPRMSGVEVGDLPI